MTEPIPAPLTQPEFEGLTIQISPGSEPATTSTRAREALADSLQAVLGQLDDGWTVKAVSPSRPGMFDLLPSEIGALTVRQAWDLTYALLEQPSVIDAEPSFEILPDVGDQAAGEVTEEEVAALANLAPVAAGEPPIFSKDDPEWCPKLILAKDAWEVEPHPGGDGLPAGKRKGEDIRVGHPDSGFREHAELRGNPNRFRDDRGFDFIGDDPVEEDEQGGHGLGTASVLMSSEGGTGQKFVTGVAPLATTIPYRVTRPHFGIHPAILFKSGMLRLADAIFHAVDEDQCHVISISLGWLKNEKVHEAVKHAFDKDVIVVAAAGNGVRFFVVWPAAYPEVISCAGCTSKRRRWSPSSRGKRVDVTGPAEDVWKAAIQGNGSQGVEQSSGTSFAAASTAGVAALWLARWGRDRLLQRYGGEFRLTTVFRKMLTDSCDPEPAEAEGKFGKGIVNAKRLLETELPTREELRASLSPVLEAVALAVSEPTSVSGMRTVAEAFADVPRPELRERVATVLGIPDADLEARLQGVGRELVFQILTDPAAREAVLVPEAAPSPLASAAPAVAATAARQQLLGAPLSARLRSRIEAG